MYSAIVDDSYERERERVYLYNITKRRVLAYVISFLQLFFINVNKNRSAIKFAIIHIFYRIGFSLTLPLPRAGDIP